MLIFLTLVLLEYFTPVTYTVSYLYTLPILLSSIYLNPRITSLITAGASLLTLANLWIPGQEVITSAMIISRIIAVASLMVTGWLSGLIRQQKSALLQQKAQIQAQAQLSQMREDFAATLTHDLKTPILGALATLSSFQQEVFGSLTARQIEVLTILIRSQRSTLQLVETLVDVYKIDTEGLKLHLERLDLLELTNEVIATLQDLASSRRVTIGIRLLAFSDHNPPLIYGDILQLRRVLINLLSNAIYHSRRGGYVEVKLDADGKYCIVQILDHGQGIPPQDLPHLFERFYQGGSQRQTSGTGLGLYLSRQIIQAHHGMIWAENLPAGGALFAFQIPL